MADKIGPLISRQHLVGQICVGCKKPFSVGDFCTLVAIGPGDDPEARELARNGRAYNAVAIPVHYACATGIE